MKWVKVSERLPVGKGIYQVVRAYGLPGDGMEFGEFTGTEFTNYYGYRVVQWLDETEMERNYELQLKEGER